ncbi:hypothetical protein C2845_PM10G03980 [Panicum miliaceum]|uniref:NAF domain-containing protein n=1 Tax=Panicum miliaceum TaxID=4540 RepID=A0A3L6PA17_PANMI|nr:hypothetical protein C2845_PM10G03980 [Panicum miliaceum]
MNALDIISFSRGFDLSGCLFEDGEAAGSGGGPEQQHHHPAAARFVLAAPVEHILAALEGAASAAGQLVRELDDGSVSMEGTREGEHGALVVAATCATSSAMNQRCSNPTSGLGAFEL